jgi:hypothetical protein
MNCNFVDASIIHKDKAHCQTFFSHLMIERYGESEQTDILFQNRFHIEKSILSHCTYMEYHARERIRSPYIQQT